MKLHRRTVLAGLGATLISAGCTGPAGESEPDGSGGSGGATPTGEPTTTTEDPDADTSTPADPFADESCPSFRDADRTVCWHGRGSNEIYLEPERREFTPIEGNDAVETITFTLHNDRDESFRLNPHAWAVKRKRDGQWTHVAPDAHVEPLNELPGGESYRWVLSRQPRSSPMAENAMAVTADVDVGHHAFVVDGWYGNREGSDGETVECVARFDVVDAVRN